MTPSGPPLTECPLLTSAARLLVAIAASPRASQLELSKAAGISEKQVNRRIPKLEAAGYLTYTRVDRRNGYSVNLDAPLRELGARTVGDLLDLFSALTWNRTRMSVERE